jgi:hypothetical protein
MTTSNSNLKIAIYYFSYCDLSSISFENLDSVSNIASASRVGNTDNA